jgi:hypothetical protein
MWYHKRTLMLGYPNPEVGNMAILRRQFTIHDYARMRETGILTEQIFQ